MKEVTGDNLTALNLAQFLIRTPPERANSDNEFILRWIQENKSLPSLEFAEKAEMIKLVQSMGFCFNAQGTEVYRNGEICQHLYIVIQGKCDQMVPNIEKHNMRQ